MSGFPIFDLVIGIIFIYFLLSIICSSAVELWLSLLKTRAKMLELWLKTIFNTQAFDSHGIPVFGSDNKPVSVGQAIMDHCMVTALTKKGQSTSYIDAENFITALLDKITLRPRTADEPLTFVQPPPANMQEYIQKITDTQVISGELKRTILLYAHEAVEAAALDKLSAPSASGKTLKSELDYFREKLSRWYDTNADRLSGKLKRSKVMPKTIVVAIALTLALNVDSLEVSRYLYQNKEVSKQFAESAMASFQENKEKMLKAGDSTVDQVKNNLKTFQAAVPTELPMGWQGKKFSLGYLKIHLFGWLATILAITMGAPFWFDILNKISNMRSTGPKPVAAADKK